MNIENYHILAEKVLNKLIKSTVGDGNETINTYGTKIDSDKLSSMVNDHLEIYKWEWPQGVALYSMYKYYKDSGDKKYLKFLTNWYEKMYSNDIYKNVNTVAPMLGMAFLYEEIGNEEYLTKCKSWLNWILNDMPRTEEGGLQHITTHDENVQQLWDDTLFMTVLFMAKMSVLLNDQSIKEEAIRQFLLHIKYLIDPRTGLFYHGFTFNGRNHFGGILWARGNSWVTACISEVIAILQLEGGVCDFLTETLLQQVKALKNLQTDDGMWRTVLDDPQSYVETSATACFAYAILSGIRTGIIPKEYGDMALKAVDAVVRNISEDGTVLNVSYGTAMGHNKEHYLNIPICPTAYGQGLTFLVLTEMQRYLRFHKNVAP